MKNFLSIKNFKIKAVIGFIIFALVFFIIDWATKHFIFDPEEVVWEDRGTYRRGTEKSYILFGIRSVAHDNSTIFSFLGLKIPDWVYYYMSIVMALIFAVIPFFVKNTYLGIACGMIFAGIMGNSLDKVFSESRPWLDNYNETQNFGSYVRDVFYLPWLDRGTFNFADVSIIIGTTLLIFYIITSIIKDNKKEKEIIIKDKNNVKEIK